MSLHTVRVTPATHASEVENGEIIFIPTEIPNACPRNGTSMLKQIKCHILDDHASDIELLFFSNSASMEAIGAAGAKFIFGGGNTTDTLIEQAGVLGDIMLDASVGVAGTAVSNQDGIHHEVKDYTGSLIHIVRNINLPVNPGNLTSVGTSTPSSIYFAGIATGTHTYTAAGLVFEFVFEY
tara:strand:+ start:9001 stop:9543 length:543 start_codon:yes stop_codon:yes gene_type:complete